MSRLHLRPQLPGGRQRRQPIRLSVPRVAFRNPATKGFQHEWYLKVGEFPFGCPIRMETDQGTRSAVASQVDQQAVF